MKFGINIWPKAMLLLAFLVAGCEDSAHSTQDVGSEAPPRPAKVITLAGQSGLLTRSFAARVDAVKTVDLSFQVSGRLTKLPIIEGEIVEKGNLIAALDQADFKRAVREAEVTLKLREKEFWRKQTLVKKGAGSEQSLDQAETSRDLSEVSLDSARQDLDYTTIIAPFDALISRRLVENYTNVETGQAVIRVQDVSELRLLVDVPETLVATISENMVAQIHAIFPFQPDKRYPLEFREYTTEPNGTTQTYQVKFAMPRPTDGINILPGMTGTVQVSLNRARLGESSHVSVPVSAISSAPDGTALVWVMDETTHTVSARPVRLAAIEGESIPILEGLNNNETIVVAGVQALREGMKIRPISSVYEGSDSQGEMP